MRPGVYRIVFTGDLLFYLLIEVILVTVHELIHTSCGINKFHLTCIERMRCIRNLKFDKWVVLSILHLYRFPAGCGGLGHKDITIGHILENDQSVIPRMYIFFHLIFFLAPAKIHIVFQKTKSI